MKKLITELCRREGKKSQVAIGNVKEIMNCLTSIIADEVHASDPVYSNEELTKEFIAAVNKKLVRKKSGMLIDLYVTETKGA